MAPAKSKKSKKEISTDFGEEVKAELRFLQQFPILDQEKRVKAELACKSQRAERRRQLRNNKGPLITEEDIEVEVKRLKDLRIKFRREAAHWAKVKQEADIAYQRWLTPILTKMSAESDIELFDEVYNQVKLKDSIKNKECEKHQLTANYTGSGNGSGIDTSTPS